MKTAQCYVGALYLLCAPSIAYTIFKVMMAAHASGAFSTPAVLVVAVCAAEGLFFSVRRSWRDVSGG